MNSEPGASDPHPDTQFSEYAQNRVVTGMRGVSRDELRDLITEHGCWGRTLADFQDIAGVRISGDTAYITQFYLLPGPAPHADGQPESLADTWDALQREHAPPAPPAPPT